jgi:hypothetical protein
VAVVLAVEVLETRVAVAAEVWVFWVKVQTVQVDARQHLLAVAVALAAQTAVTMAVLAVLMVVVLVVRAAMKPLHVLAV